MGMYRYHATVLRWVDGDTVDLRVDLGFKMWAETRFRLYGIDAPERGQENHDEATAFAEKWAPTGSEIDIQTTKADKYGRWLVTIWVGQQTLNTLMLRQGLAKAYYGGTKS